MEKALSILKAIGFMLLGLAIQLVVGIVVGIIISFRTMIELLPSAQNDMLNFSEVLTEKVLQSGLISYITLFAIGLEAVVFCIWYYFKYAKKFLVSYVEAFRLGNCFSLIGLGIGIQLVLIILLGLILPLFPSTMNEYSETINQIVGDSGIISILTAGILAPLAEECIFRGMALKTLNKSIKFITANIIQALLFGIMHFNIIQSVYAFFIGLICGFVIQHYRTIWASILLHATINLSALCISAFVPDSVGSTWWYALGVSAIGVGLLLVNIYRVNKVCVMEEQRMTVPVYPEVIEMTINNEQDLHNS